MDLTDLELDDIIILYNTYITDGVSPDKLAQMKHEIERRQTVELGEEF